MPKRRRLRPHQNQLQIAHPPEALRWCNWAADPEGITGHRLLTFINNELFPTLKELRVADPASLAATRLVVELVNPRLGKRILDPACSTDEFLINAIEHIQARQGVQPPQAGARATPESHAWIDRLQ
jgi:hypothetical protein